MSSIPSPPLSKKGEKKGKSTKQVEFNLDHHEDEKKMPPSGYELSKHSSSIKSGKKNGRSNPPISKKIGEGQSGVGWKDREGEDFHGPSSFSLPFVLSSGNGEKIVPPSFSILKESTAPTREQPQPPTRTMGRAAVAGAEKVSQSNVPTMPPRLGSAAQSVPTSLPSQPSGSRTAAPSATGSPPMAGERERKRSEEKTGATLSQHCPPSDANGAPLGVTVGRPLVALRSSTDTGGSSDPSSMGEWDALTQRGVMRCLDSGNLPSAIEEEEIANDYYHQLYKRHASTEMDWRMMRGSSDSSRGSRDSGGMMMAGPHEGHRGVGEVEASRHTKEVDGRHRKRTRSSSRKGSKKNRSPKRRLAARRSGRRKRVSSSREKKKKHRSTTAQKKRGHSTRKSPSKSSSERRSRSLSGSHRGRKKGTNGSTRRHHMSSSPPAPLSSTRLVHSHAKVPPPSCVPPATLAPPMHPLYQRDSPLSNTAERHAAHFPSAMTSLPHSLHASPQALHTRMPLASGGVQDEFYAPRRVLTPPVVQESPFHPTLHENSPVPCRDEEEMSDRRVQEVCYAPHSPTSSAMERPMSVEEEEEAAVRPLSEEDARVQGRTVGSSQETSHPPPSSTAAAAGIDPSNRPSVLVKESENGLPSTASPTQGKPPPPSSSSIAFLSTPQATTGSFSVSNGSVDGSLERRKGAPFAETELARSTGNASRDTKKEGGNRSSSVRAANRHAPLQGEKRKQGTGWTKDGSNEKERRGGEKGTRGGSSTHSASVATPSRPAVGSRSTRASFGGRKGSTRRPGVNITELCLRKINPLSFASVKDRKKRYKAMAAEVFRAYEDGVRMFEAEYMSELARVERQFREASFEPQSREILRLVEGIQFVRMDCHQKLGLAETVVNTLTTAMEKLLSVVHEKGRAILARDETLLEDKVLDGTPSAVEQAEGVPLPEVQGVLERCHQPRYAPSRTMVLPGDTKDAVENFFGKELQFIHQHRLELTQSLVVPFFDDPVVDTEKVADDEDDETKEVHMAEKSRQSAPSEGQTSVAPRSEVSSSTSHSVSPPRKERESVVTIRSGKTKKSAQNGTKSFTEVKKNGGRREKGPKTAMHRKRASTGSPERKERSAASSNSAKTSTVKQRRSASSTKESGRGRRRSRASTGTKSGSSARRRSSGVRKKSTDSFSSKNKMHHEKLSKKRKNTVTLPKTPSSSLRTIPSLHDFSGGRSIPRAKSLREGDKAKEESVLNHRSKSRTSSSRGASTASISSSSRKRKSGVPTTSLLAPPSEKKKSLFFIAADSTHAEAQTSDTAAPYPTGRETRKSFADTASKYSNVLRAYSVFTNEHAGSIETQMTLLTEAMEHFMSHLASRHDLYRRKILAQQRLLDETTTQRKVAADVLQSQKDSEALGVELIAMARHLGEELRGRMDTCEKEMRETIQNALDDSAVVSMEQLAYRDANDKERKKSQVMRHVVCRMERSMLDQAEIMREVQYVIVEMWSKCHPKGREEHNTFLHRSLPTPYENILQRCGRDTLIRLLHHLSLQNDDALRLLIGALDEREHFLSSNTAEAQAEREEEATLAAVKALLSKMYTEGRIHSNPNKTGSTVTETVQYMVEQYNAFMSFTENYARALLRRDRKRLGKYASLPLFHPDSALPEVLRTIQEEHAKMVASGGIDNEGNVCDREAGNTVVPALRNPYPSLITSHFVGWSHKKASSSVGAVIAPSISSPASSPDSLRPPKQTGSVPSSSSHPPTIARDGNALPSSCSSSPLPPTVSIQAADHCFSAHSVKRETNAEHSERKTTAVEPLMAMHTRKPATALPSLPRTAAAVATEMEKANPSISDPLLTGVSVVGHGRWDGRLPVRGTGRSHHVPSDGVSGTTRSASWGLENNAVRVPCPPPREYSAISRALNAEAASKKVIVPGPPLRKDLHDHILEKHNHSINELNTLMNEVLDPAKTDKVCRNTLSLFGQKA